MDEEEEEEEEAAAGWVRAWEEDEDDDGRGGRLCDEDDEEEGLLFFFFGVFGEASYMRKDSKDMVGVSESSSSPGPGSFGAWGRPAEAEEGWGGS